ncbi:NTP transferase domain-containing protein [bacterium]|nr:NTP transferase domain-containing protein [bacterium]
MGTPKALTSIGGNPAAEVLYATCLKGGFQSVVLVLGKDIEVITSALDSPSIIPIHNPHPERGRTGSIQVGIHALGKVERGVLLWPIDHPLVTLETIQLIEKELIPHGVVCPQYKGKSGHPIGIGADLLPSLMAEEPHTPLRTWISVQNRHYLDVNDPGILRNIDYPLDAKGV